MNTCSINAISTTITPSHSEHFSVDQTRLSSGAVTLQATPDVLIVPSPIKPGSHVVDGSICINPGHLSTLKAAGTYAKICVHPMPPAQVQAYYDKKMSELRMKREAKMETDNEEEENDRTEEGIVIGHAADKRTRVDVVKI
ncbi:hypothetical protein BC829DRAFT_489043 [Chytridium lagenaria]|nr:hypothetical protein BC829DRAFT_489043 [Chytridium lagenaria]